MKAFLAIPVLVILLVIAVYNSITRQEWKEKGTLEWVAKKAKKEGKQKVVIRAPLALYVSVNSLEEALDNFDVIVVEVVGSKSSKSSPHNIQTWYRLRVLETIHSRPVRECPSCPSPGSPPQDMLPVKADEILVPKYGGGLKVDDVDVVSVDPDFPELSPSQKYLLFISLDHSHRVGALTMGPQSVFTVENDGSIKPLDGRHHPLKDNIWQQGGGHVDKLKARIKDGAPRLGG